MPTWNSSLAVGVPVIDRQHQELFARTDALLTAMKTGKSGQEVGELLRFLEAYCVEHFATEAKLMRRIAYPATAQHLALHEHFTSEFAKIKETFAQKGASATVTLSIQSLFCSWLVKHIGSVDKALAAHVTSTKAEAV